MASDVVEETGAQVSCSGVVLCQNKRGDRIKVTTPVHIASLVSQNSFPKAGF